MNGKHSTDTLTPTERNTVFPILEKIFEFASPVEYMRHNHYMLNTYMQYLEGVNPDLIADAVFMTNLQNEIICELFQEYVELKKEKPCRN
jgi:hypothetical protein